jgi:hypothetical protein
MRLGISKNINQGKVRGRWLRPGPMPQGMLQGSQGRSLASYGYYVQLRPSEAAALSVLNRGYVDFREHSFCAAR